MKETKTVVESETKKANHESAPQATSLDFVNNTMEMTADEVAICDIKIPENHRETSQEVIDSLAESIKNAGLIYPPIISSDNVLVAGHHRIKALEKLGIESIKAYQLPHPYESDECRLITLTENVERKELSRVEKAFAIYETFKILKRIRPSNDGNLKLSRKKLEIVSDNKITKQLMEKFKIKKSEFYELIGLAKSVIPEMREHLKTQNLTDDFKIAVDISGLTPGQQEELIKSQPTKDELLKSLKEVVARNANKINPKTDKAKGDKEQKQDLLIAEVDAIMDQIGNKGYKIRYEEYDKYYEVRLNDNSLLQTCDNAIQLHFFLKGMLKLAEIKKPA